MPPAEKRLLIVDDDTDDIDFFQSVLQDMNGNITCFTTLNGEIALKLLRDQKTELPDYIFADMNMPRINGKQLLKEIKDIDSLRHIPVIIYSTTGAESDINETKRMGATAFLIKPTRRDELMKQLKTILNL